MNTRFDPERLDLAREFRAKPMGTHSTDLERLLDHMRGAPMEGKHFLYMTKPHSEWILGRLSDERPLRPIFMREHVFHSLEDAEWFVFKLRWEKLTGSPLDLD